MWSSVDAVSPDHVPAQNYARIYVILYIVLIILICLLFLNLFVGVVCDTFNKEKTKLTLNQLLKESEK